MKAQIQPHETGGYSNTARIKLYNRLKTYDENTVCFNRETYKEWGINKKPISRFVYAFTSHSMKEVAGWKVDLGGANIASFEPVVKVALHTVIAYNAKTFFSNVTLEQIDDLVQLVFSRKSHMSLYAFTDAMESLVQKESPCDIDLYGFDAKAIVRACDMYYGRARDLYYEWEKSAQVKETFKGDAVPMPEGIKQVRERLEQKFGVVYDDNSAREQHRKAQEWFEGQKFE